nr:hypothetical protein Iba_chr13cCG16700 [Ipomoea batatas]
MGDEIGEVSNPKSDLLIISGSTKEETPLHSPLRQSQTSDGTPYALKIPPSATERCEGIEGLKLEKVDRGRSRDSILWTPLNGAHLIDTPNTTWGRKESEDPFEK